MKNWHNLNIVKIFQLQKSNKKGLNDKDVEKKRKEFGYNKLPEKKSLSRLILFLDQIKSPLVYVLIFAAIISFFLKHFTDAGVIFFVVIINTVFGYWQESKANNAIKHLKKIVRHKARVLRGGRQAQVQSEELVPGDVIYLQAGDKVPADARLFINQDLQTNEAPLTGESSPIDKNTKVIDEDTVLAERINMVYMGTLITRGHGQAVVCATGVKTEIGKISKLLKETEDGKTPLQLKLIQFSRWLTVVVLGLSFLIFTLGFAVGKDPSEMFIIAVALAVAAIPEGLLVAVTIILTVGMQFILKRKALVRKLVAAETLGSISVICTDKTGTLTEGVMRVSKIITADRDYSQSVIDRTHGLLKVQDLIYKVSALCTNAVIENPGEALEKLKIIGDPTERALLQAATEIGVDKDQLDKEYKKLEEISFNSEKKYMATWHDQKKDKHQHIFVKGAPEKVFAFCDKVMIEGKKVKLDKEQLEYLKSKYERITKKGLRLLGFAYKTGHFDKLEGELDEMVFLGFAALKDPLRPETKDTIKLCQKAGIRPVIITGDHRLTAEAIFTELGLKTGGNVVEGKELDGWNDAKLKRKVVDIDIYARVEPKHKLRIIKAWQARGEVVAMTGDGINDAPAIKSADIGVALGSGSDVTKESADIILLNDNFKVIVAAVEQGRIIFDNIRKVILYLLSDSFSEIILITGSLLLGLPLPVLATQILWINLAADGLPNLAMALEPGEKEVMNDKPRKKSDPILNKEMKILIFVIGIITDIILLALFVVLLKMFTDIDYIRTIIFAALGFDSLLYVFSVRTLRHSIFTQNPFKNKYLVGAVIIAFGILISAIYIPLLQSIFHTVYLGWKEWVLIISLAIMKIFMIEMVKHYFIVKKHHEKILEKN